jgi:mannose-6-phosphate isomerase-like protein (cupin superfamily)
VKVVGPADGKSGSLGMIGVRFMIDGDETEGRFSLVEHPMPPRALAAPLHRHLREDEYSFVLEGQVGALLGDEVVIAGPGDLLFKPRNQWHTFWNAGDEPRGSSRSSPRRASSASSTSSSTSAAP